MANDSQGMQKITITCVGDCTLGKNQRMEAEGSWGDLFDKNGAGYFMQNVAPYFKASNVAIANLEGVLAVKPSKLEIFYRQRINEIQPRKYRHLGKPRYLKALSGAGIDVVTFANNHNIDYGLDGFVQTVDACRKYKTPVAYYDHVVRYPVGNRTVGVFAMDGTFVSVDVIEGYVRRAMADLRRDCDIIVACMHWGENYKLEASKEQVRLGHLCIDLGASVVFGSHAHVLQGVERYKGRYIFYSLGNFCYGGRETPKDPDTMIAQQTFTFADGELLIDDDVRVIPCWNSRSAEVNDFCPIVKDGEEGQGIIDKLNGCSEPFGLKFDDDGRPMVEPATDTAIPACDDVFGGGPTDKVPEIIKTLLDVEGHKDTAKSWWNRPANQGKKLPPAAQALWGE